jgi:zinc transport system substrate-binding protein
LFFACAGCGLPHCGAADGPRDRRTEKPVIAVTIVPQQTFVEAVCGDLAEVITMVSPGNSPENYELTAREMERFSDAALYFSIGVRSNSEHTAGAGSVKVISCRRRLPPFTPNGPCIGRAGSPHMAFSQKSSGDDTDHRGEMSLLDPATRRPTAKTPRSICSGLRIWTGK